MDTLVHHLLRTSARAAPEKEALVHDGDRLDYARIDDLTSRLANGLLAAGLGRGERVGVFLDKSVNEVLSIFGVSKAGGVFVPINSLLFPEQVGHIMNDCAVSGLITTAAKLAEIDAVVKRTDTLKFVICVDGEVSMDGVHTASLASILESASPAAPADVCIGNDMASLLYTSGSTGRPKGVVLSHANLIAGSHIVSTYLEITREERIVSILPFSFDYGLNQLLTAFQHGATLVLKTFKFPGEVVQTLIDEKITGFAGVPPLWTLMTQPRSPVYKHDLPHLRYITNSGGAVPAELLAALRKAFDKTRVYLMYGLTEAFRSTYLPPDEIDRRPGSMGKAIPDTEIFLVNDKGERCKPGEVGELVHRGPTVSLGYWNRPEDTAKVLRPHPFAERGIQREELVCYSGDLVKMDEDGYLYFVARRDATIKSSGHRISPTEVEEVIFSSGRVRDAAVIGVPDDTLGQAIKAFVAPRDGEVLDSDDLIAYCSEKMPRYMIPREIEILEEIPKTSSGKIDYTTLRKREAGVSVSDESK